MEININTETKKLLLRDGSNEEILPLYGTRAFELISDLWLKLGWNAKYPYTFSWMGRPLIQLPEDVVRIQEVIYRQRPDVIIETGVAHGGSLIFYASLFEAMGTAGRVVGIDIDIRKHNRAEIESHSLFKRITLIEGSSVDSEIVYQVKSHVNPGDRVMVVLDSDHSYAHVYGELEAYFEVVSPGSYIVATDGIMRDVADTPRGKSVWVSDNPTAAARDFVAKHKEFVIEEPNWVFNESDLSKTITHWPGAWIKRVDSSAD